MDDEEPITPKLVLGHHAPYSEAEKAVRDALKNVQELLVTKRDERDQLNRQIKDLVEEEDYLTQAARAFDRKRAKTKETTDAQA